MKYLLVGIGISFISMVVALIMSDWSLLYKITGIVGVACIGIAGLLSGGFVSGDQFARNYNSESHEDRFNRISNVSKILMIGAPNIIVAITALYLN
ncbi:DUF5316 domain-containing protein [Psychrobacillus sp. L3]|uniref:DUF5316 domain-containing protein n=1 Tax=Psychrobacillus sp. L3 TaxID=3236891 RepID=UPI0036F3797C